MLAICSLVIGKIEDRKVIGYESKYREKFVFPEGTKVITDIKNGPVPSSGIIVPVWNLRKVDSNLYYGIFDKDLFLEKLIEILAIYGNKIETIKKGTPEKDTMLFISKVSNLINLLFYNTGYFSVYLEKDAKVKAIKKTYNKLVFELEILTKENKTTKGGKKHVRS